LVAAAQILLQAEPEISFAELDGSNVRVGIIATRWNDDVITKLKNGAMEALKECGVQEKNVFETQVPGAFELPLASRYLALSNTVDVIINIGCLIKGDTMHFEYICEAASSGLMRVGLDTGVPCIFGVLTVLSKEQALDRAKEDKSNSGYVWGKSAVEMAILRSDAMGARGVKKMGLNFAKDGLNGEKSGGTPGTKPKIGF